MLYSVFIFTDSFHRTGFFARHRNIDDGMIRATLMTDTATDTRLMVDHCLTVFLETYGIFGAVHIATTGHTSATKVGYFIINLYAGRTRFVNDAHYIFFIRFGTAQCLLRIFGERSYFVVFVRHIQSHQREGLVSPYSTFFMYAATPQRF